MKLLPLLCLSVLLLAGCATIDSAKERPNPAGAANFSKIDADGSGTVTLAEIEALADR